MAGAKHYSYRVDHDLGFAPHIHQKKLCTLCGCKMTSIEKWATRGSWVVGIGGKKTGKTDMLIYAMEVHETLPYNVFRKTHPKQSVYLAQKVAGGAILADAPVLISTHFYYFGDNAKPLRPELATLIHSAQGCKRLTDDDISTLKLVLRGYPRVSGNPNNAPVDPPCGKKQKPLAKQPVCPPTICT
jgi:hypothetical protein